MMDSDRNPVTVLDHGYLTLIESWGSDERIIESARMSTNKGFQGWGKSCGICGGTGTCTSKGYAKCDQCDGKGGTTGDEKLLRYLYEHRHNTPFEMAGMTIEVQAPIFVFREWHRHRTQSYNEMSARYTPLPDLNYTPTIDRILQSGGSNKQAIGITGMLTENLAQIWTDDLSHFYIRAQQLYEEGLSFGVPKELARLCLPVARYSRMRASANLRNWLAFLTLRMDSVAQWEIRQYANEVGSLVGELFPRTYELFVEGKR